MCPPFCSFFTEEKAFFSQGLFFLSYLPTRFLDVETKGNKEKDVMALYESQ